MPREPHQQDQIFFGKPIPASQITRIIYINQEHIAALKAIPVGFAQETTMSRPKAQSFIERLERSNEIKHGEYKVKTRTNGDKQQVLILHAGANAQTFSSRLDTEANAEIVAKAQQVILAQTDFVHNIKSVADQLGVTIDGHDKDKTYRQLSNALEEARARIVQEKMGRFVQEKQGHYLVYKWQNT